MIRVFSDPEALSQAIADHFAALARGAERFSVALSGGNSPVRLYELLAERSDIDWSRIHLFFGDERYVPPTDPLSNERMARESLIDEIEIPTENVHPMYSPAGWEESVQAYEKLLRDFFRDSQTTFDLALQGIGEDGHTASVFPGQPEPPADRWVVRSTGPAQAPERITLTLDCLAASQEILFLVEGAGKAGPLAKVLDDVSAPAKYPAATLASKAANVQWWIDEAAAARLHH